MSSEAQPIPAEVFAEAIKSLPLSSLYAKVSELRNSIAHLSRSNEELRTYIRESEDGPDSPDNKELENYVLENEAVMQAMAQRIGLLKAEVEDRGQQWMEEVLADDEAGAAEELTPNGVLHETDAGHVNGAPTPSGHQHEDSDGDDEGIHL
ncbi:uncharacterized protein TRUGW13939_03586 [Talaromyces rugulosus]|uniref:Uncharacterized protein n=1 Tax=Talaromyces rugulosus TaxID=121627 RepID=A0A7H8QSM0_TALRU|nr:uncharacterized protein TRUGW13939_03586 [Talaromyces rugulosus]QKX56481.1 hypothetical protein TRUGW13939_03586 [Talaromyces rugulosus]